ncbi:TetR/AcrR family transcriptional regulator [Pedobacter metabolipauper]|uniref:TetR family transcriptional regulator n=1 Tax=Pedobacter metabolipauper TaxID=425513 RepID=A0A4R6SZ87_9SPHI|nr:TetR/AcrR family transcriptional regulator [Pedobacter metabolipauper]TDQ11089.1 TetR family transcriptional regulator [Pedobacter metabolipauper]
MSNPASSSKAERTRTFIIEKTADVFNKKGYAGTSLSDLTGVTGLTKGSIYGNFESKEEVALAVFDYNYERIVRITQEEILKADTFHARLMVYARVYKNMILDPLHPGGCPILNTAIEADDTNPQLREKAAKAIDSWQQRISWIINDGIAAGEFKADVPVSRVALSIIALIEGAVMIAKVTGDPARMDEIMRTVATLIEEMKSK